MSKSENARQSQISWKIAAILSLADSFFFEIIDPTFQVNGGVNSLHILPSPTSTELIQFPCFDALEKSNQPVLELLEKCRSQKALAKANGLLNNAVGRTFMTQNEKLKFQDWIKLLPAQYYPPNMKVLLFYHFR